MTRYANLNNSATNFADMIQRFGVVTVMNADVYDLSTLIKNWSKFKYGKDPKDITNENRPSLDIYPTSLPTTTTTTGSSTVEEVAKTSVLNFLSNYTVDQIYKLALIDKEVNKDSSLSGNFLTTNFSASATETKVKRAYLCTLDSLKIANATQEGPTKTITGGRYANPLIKFGKNMRLEMQDALGSNKALDALCGTITEYNKAESGAETAIAVHATEDFTGEKLIIGDTFFIDQKTGKQVKVKIIFFRFLPDSIFNLTQDAEGDATVFDMNGDLLTAEIKMGNNAGSNVVHGSFYAIADLKDYVNQKSSNSNGTGGTSGTSGTGGTGGTGGTPTP